jgi:hypothetical protein
LAIQDLITPEAMTAFIFDARNQGKVMVSEVTATSGTPLNCPMLFKDALPAARGASPHLLVGPVMAMLRLRAETSPASTTPILAEQRGVVNHVVV